MFGNQKLLRNLAKHRKNTTGLFLAFLKAEKRWLFFLNEKIQLPIGGAIFILFGGHSAQKISDQGLHLQHLGQRYQAHTTLCSDFFESSPYLRTGGWFGRSVSVLETEGS